MAEITEPPIVPEEPVLANRIPVIEYHGTDYKGGATIQMKSKWFLEHLQWLSENGYQSLTGEQLVAFVQGASRPAMKSFVLRFDLGLAIAHNVREIILPALQKHGFHAIFLLLTNAVKEQCIKNYLCWPEILTWEQTGLVEIGSHGVYHPDYKKLSQAQRIWDAKTSKARIEAKLGHPIYLFGYPYDSVPPKPETLLKPLGYQLALAGYRIERSVRFQDPNPYSLPCYYPYSYDKLYPKITGTKGLTFGQMIEKAL